MEIKSKRAAVRHQAFTLMEVMLAVVIVGVEFVSLYVAISQGFAVVQSARENLRATQIMQEQVEIIRVLDWDKVTTTPSPWNFNATFYPAGGTNQGQGLA
jgi:prepilin-type N-terminal cleavage/methylation domain-containing protein